MSGFSSAFILLLGGLALAVLAPRITGMRWAVGFPPWGVLPAVVYYHVRLIKAARVVEGITLELWAASLMLSAAQFAPLPADWRSLLLLVTESIFVAGLGIILIVMLPWAMLGNIVPKWSPVRRVEDGVKRR
jgi:hypothetical protein